MDFNFFNISKFISAITIVFGIAILILSWYAFFLVDEEFNLRQKSFSALEIANTAMDIVNQNYYTDGRCWIYLYSPSKQKFQDYLEGFLLSKSKTESMFLTVQAYSDSVYGGGPAQLDKIRVDKDIENIVLQLKNYYDDYDAEEKSGIIEEALLKNNEFILKSKINETLEAFSDNQRKYSQELMNKVSAAERKVKICVIAFAFGYLILLVLLVLEIKKISDLVSKKHRS